MSKRKKTPSLADLLIGMPTTDLMMLREAVASCAIEDNPTADALGRALDQWMAGQVPTGPDAKALHGYLLRTQ